MLGGWCRAAVVCVLLAMSRAQRTEIYEEAHMLAHCGKKFRIATYHCPPFVMVDATLCVDQKCQPHAFESAGGGMIYDIFMRELLPRLKEQCEENNHPSPNVEFEWYIVPPSMDFTSLENAVALVCQGAFHREALLSGLSPKNPICPSSITYKGPSPARSLLAGPDAVGPCSGAYGKASASCVSSGPDLVVGGLQITSKLQDMLALSLPYMPCEQMLVKRPTNVFAFKVNLIGAVFAPFAAEVWVAWLVLILTVLIMLYHAESFKKPFNVLGPAPKRPRYKSTVAPRLPSKPLVHKQKQKQNPLLEEGFPHVLFDVLYWAFGDALSPGAAGKSPVSAEGRLYIVGSITFSTILIASYTGTVGPSMARTAEQESFGGLAALRSGMYSIAVKGPKFEPEDPENTYLGLHRGSNLPRAKSLLVPPSAQFDLLQREMQKTSDISYRMYTSERTISSFADGTPVLPNDAQNPCSQTGWQLGLYDLVMCRGQKGAVGEEFADKLDKDPFSLMDDAAAVIYNLRERFNAADRQHCPLVSSGNAFHTAGYGVGFPKNSTHAQYFPDIFSRAFLRLQARGTFAQYLAKHRLRAIDNPCQEALYSRSDSLDFFAMSGLFLLSGILIIAPVVWTCFARTSHASALSTIERREHERVMRIREQMAALDGWYFKGIFRAKYKPVRRRAAETNMQTWRLQIHSAKLLTEASKDLDFARWGEQNSVYPSKEKQREQDTEGAMLISLPKKRSAFAKTWGKVRKALGTRNLVSGERAHDLAKKQHQASKLQYEQHHDFERHYSDVVKNAAAGKASGDKKDESQEMKSRVLQSLTPSVLQTYEEIYGEEDQAGQDVKAGVAGTAYSAPIDKVTVESELVYANEMSVLDNFWVRLSPQADKDAQSTGFYSNKVFPRQLPARTRHSDPLARQMVSGRASLETQQERPIVRSQSKATRRAPLVTPLSFRKARLKKGQHQDAQDAHTRYRLQVELIEAASLPKVGMLGLAALSDYYVSLQMMGSQQHHKSQVVSSLDPVWSESYVFTVDHARDHTLIVRVLQGADKLAGVVHINIRDVEEVFLDVDPDNNWSGEGKPRKFGLQNEKQGGAVLGKDRRASTVTLQFKAADDESRAALSSLASQRGRSFAGQNAWVADAGTKASHGARYHKD